MRKKAPSSPRHRRGSRHALDAESRRNKVANNQVDRVLAQDHLEATQDYVRRGRHLEHLDTDALKQHWIAALTSFFHDRSPERMRGLDDATSELGLRGLSPDALVPPEIWAAMQAEIAQDRDDPEALAAVEKKSGSFFRKKDLVTEGGCSRASRAMIGFKLALDRARGGGASAAQCYGQCKKILINRSQLVEGR